MTTEAPIIKSLADVRKDAFAEATAATKKLKTQLLFRALLRCVDNGTQDKDRRLRTHITLADSSFEDIGHVALGLKISGTAVSSWFETGRHYTIQLHVPPTDAKQEPVLVKMEGEIVAVLVYSTHVGKAVGKDEESPHKSIVVCNTDGLKLGIKREDDGELADMLSVATTYRLAIMAAPEWLERVDTKRIEDEKEASRLAVEKMPKGSVPIPFGEEG